MPRNVFSVRKWFCFVRRFYFVPERFFPVLDSFIFPEWLFPVRRWFCSVFFPECFFSCPAVVFVPCLAMVQLSGASIVRNVWAPSRAPAARAAFFPCCFCCSCWCCCCSCCSCWLRSWGCFACWQRFIMPHSFSCDQPTGRNTINCNNHRYSNNRNSGRYGNRTRNKYIQ